MRSPRLHPGRVEHAPGSGRRRNVQPLAVAGPEQRLVGHEEVHDEAAATGAAVAAGAEKALRRCYGHGRLARRAGLRLRLI